MSPPRSAIHGTGSVEDPAPLRTEPFFEKERQPKCSYADPPPSVCRGRDGNLHPVLSAIRPIGQTHTMWIGSEGRAKTRARVAFARECENSLISPSFALERDLKVLDIIPPGEKRNVLTIYGLLHEDDWNIAVDLKVSAKHLGIREDAKRYSVVIPPFNMDGVDMIIGDSMLCTLSYRFHTFGNRYGVPRRERTRANGLRSHVHASSASSRSRQHRRLVPGEEEGSRVRSQASAFGTQHPPRPAHERYEPSEESSLNHSNSIPFGQVHASSYASGSYEGSTQRTSTSTGPVSADITSAPSYTKSGSTFNQPPPFYQKGHAWHSQNFEAQGSHHYDAQPTFYGGVHDSSSIGSAYLPANWSSLAYQAGSQSVPQPSNVDFYPTSWPHSELPASQPHGAHPGHLLNPFLPNTTMVPPSYQPLNADVGSSGPLNLGVTNSTRISGRSQVPALPDSQERNTTSTHVSTIRGDPGTANAPTPDQEHYQL